jgi:predicted nucleic acid-binding protein
VAERTVVVDANVLINLSHLDRLDLLGALKGFDFVIPQEVRQEVKSAEARDRLDRALDLGDLRETPLVGLETLALFADFLQIMGRGESACLALATMRGWHIASDEKRAFLREAQRHLGPGHILNTPGLLVLAVRRNLLTIEQADEAKAVLERCRFRMAFGSFREILDPTPPPPG